VPRSHVRDARPPALRRDDELAKAFSAVAPVKRAFIVKDVATHASRGFGFVQL
jgi:hypothetical protein